MWCSTKFSVGPWVLYALFVFNCVEQMEMCDICRWHKWTLFWAGHQKVIVKNRGKVEDCCRSCQISNDEGIYLYIYTFIWVFQLSKWTENLRLVGKNFWPLDGANKTFTVCTFKLKRKELAWSPAQTACINKACRRKCDVRAGFDRFVSGEIPRVWCRFSYIVTFEGFSLGLQENVSSCLFLTHWSWDGVEL